ncbi:MAG: hypothetical protein D6690_00190 [Nitrospirae bacterium]|nr:MAG: hypothetical protein D6690_00190 [Nitrospirota bacterium]
MAPALRICALLALDTMFRIAVVERRHRVVILIVPHEQKNSIREQPHSPSLPAWFSGRLSTVLVRCT